MPSKPSGAAAPGQVRIIGGDLRRSIVPVVAVEGLRPTPDRVRETLFNWLGQTLPPVAVLDAFAGTGALGLEALSRGAAHVAFFETNALVRKQLEQTAKRLSARLQRPGVNVSVSGQDVCTHLRGAREAGFRYDLALLDPPFKSDWLQKALPLVLASMNAGGRVYVEWHARLGDDASVSEAIAQAGWCIDREQKAGQVFYHLLKPGPGAGA